MNRYEAVFILTPVLSDDQVKEAVDKFKKILTDSGAKFTHDEDWGLRKLAYPIQKKSTGFYRLIEFEVDPSAIANFEVELRRDERIIRFLTTRMENHHITYAESRRDRGYAKPSAPKTEA